MSKKQTPITAEEIKRTISKKLSQIFRGKTIYMAEVEKDIEQYAQAKVLEALEREVKRVYVMMSSEYNDLAHKDADKYYETEVKPKYKQINK